MQQHAAGVTSFIRFMHRDEFIRVDKNKMAASTHNRYPGTAVPCQIRVVPPGTAVSFYRTKFSTEYELVPAGCCGRLRKLNIRVCIYATQASTRTYATSRGRHRHRHRPAAATSRGVHNWVNQVRGCSCSCRRRHSIRDEHAYILCCMSSRVRDHEDDSVPHPAAAAFRPQPRRRVNG